jgi:ankyrin repeat protein
MSEENDDDEEDHDFFLYDDEGGYSERGGAGHLSGAPDSAALEAHAQLLECRMEIQRLRSELDGQRALVRQMQEVLITQQPSHSQRTPERLMTPLLEACKNGDASVVSVLLTDAHERWGGIDNALQVACEYGNVEIAVLLIETGGADVNADHGMALMWACKQGDAELARALLDRGADPRSLQDLPIRLARYVWDEKRQGLA